MKNTVVYSMKYLLLCILVKVSLGPLLYVINIGLLIPQIKI